MATGGSARQQSVEYSLKVEIDDLKRALNDSLTLLKGNDAGVRALADQLNLLANQQTRVANGARNQTRQFTQATRATRELSEASRSAGINIRGMLFQVGALVGVFGVADVFRRTGMAIYENARAYDTIRAKIGLLTDDSREQADIMDYVRGVAARLGVEQRSLIDSYVRLRIASRGSVVEGKATQAVFEGLTTASAALRLSTDETRRAMKAFEQIISKGKLSAEEIRQQLGDVLPGALQVFQEASGKSAREFDKLLAEGKLFIDSGMFEKIAGILQRDYSKGVRLDTIAAQVSLLKNAYDELFQTINMGGGREAIAGGIGKLAEMVKNATKFMDSARFSGIEFAHSITVIGTAVGALLAANLLTRLAASLTLVSASVAATGLASIGNVARVLAFRNALLAMLAPFGGPLGVAAVAAVVFFSTYRDAAQKAADKTLELRNRTSDLIDIIDILSKQAAQTRLDAVRAEIEKTKKMIDDLEAKMPKRPTTIQDVARSGKNEFGPVSSFNQQAGLVKQLEEARIQFGLMSGEAIRLEGRLAAVEREGKKTATTTGELSGATDKATKSFLEEMDIMRLKLDLMTEGYDLDQLDIVAKGIQAGLSRDQIGDYLQLTAALQGYTDEQKRAKKEAEDLARETEKAAEALDKFLEKDSLKSLGSTLRDAFNEAGGALGDIIGRLEDIGNIQEENAKARANNDKVNAKGSKKHAAEEVRIANKIKQAYAGTYASMAGAAKGFFSANSRGYKALQAVEQGYRLAELSLAIGNTLTKIGLEEAFLGAKLSSDVTAAQSTVANAEVQVAANTAVGQSAAITGTAQQATVDPVTAFARMAVMASLMAALGFAVGAFGGGGKKVDIAKQRQAKQGTGTVFGDASAKSASLGNALSTLTDLQSDELDVSMDMLRSLRAIEADLTGVTRLVLRDMPVFGKKGSLIKANAQDTGLDFQSGQTLKDIRERGADLSFYGDYISLVGGDSSVAASKEMTKQFTQLINGISDSILLAVEGVGGDLEAAKLILDETALGIDLISLHGLSGEDAQKAIEAVFSTLADNLAEEVIPAMEEFQNIGEGLFETLVRVGAQTAATTYLLADLGISLASLDFIERARITQSIIALSGGFEEFAGNMSDFIESFYTADERLEMMGGRLARTFADLGLAVPASREAFRDLVTGINLTEFAGQKLFAALIAIAPQMDELFTLQQEVSDTTDALTVSFTGLLKAIRLSIMELEGGDLSLAEFNESILELLSADTAEERLAAGERLHEAIMGRYEDEVSRIEEARDAQIESLNAQRQIAEDSVKTWAQAQKIILSISDYLEDLKRSPLAPGTPLERTQIALEQFRAQASLALGGDMNAAGGLQQLAGEVLNMARETFASGGPYSDIYGEITGSLGMVAEALGMTPGGEAQATLDTIDAQIAAASATADALLEQLRLDTILQLTSLGEYIQYGNSRLDALLSVLTGGATPAPLPLFGAPQTAVSAAPADSGAAEVVAAIQQLQTEVAAIDQPVNITLEAGDGTRTVVATTLREIRERSARGETVVYRQGVQ